MIRKLFTTFFLLGLLILFRDNIVSAQTVDDCANLPKDQKPDCYAKKVNELQGQTRTLSSQIAVMDSQIRLTEARIEYNKQQISNLTLDIDTAGKKIVNLEKALEERTKVFLNRIVAAYEIGTIKPFQILITSTDAGSFVSRLNYLKIARDHDRELIFAFQQAKNDYANQKTILETQKKRIELLKNQLLAYSKNLDQQKQDKQILLDITQNDESIYQQKLQAALEEQQAIKQIGISGGNAVFIKKVNEGDIIGHIIDGRSACSSGRHLHFEVHKDNNTQDPSQYLGNKGVTFDNSPDGSFSFGGSWSWPINDQIYIEQGYGMTYWARLGWYNGGPHTGIDMDSNSSLDVRAVKGGDLYRGGIACGGGTLLFGRVDQADGIQVFYLHTYP